MKSTQFLAWLAALILSLAVFIVLVVFQVDISNVLIENTENANLFSLLIVFTGITGFSTLAQFLYTMLSNATKPNDDNPERDLPEDEARLLDYYRSLDEEDQRKARKAVKKISQE